MKIIIVGAGIAGLSAYLHLRKHLPSPSTHTITIYESHHPRRTPSSDFHSSETHTENFQSTDINLATLSESTAIVGGGLGISPNGMRVLRNLDIELHNAVVAQGFPVSHFVFRGANGWVLGASPTTDRTVRNEDEGEEEVCVASSRHGLRETLLKFVLQAGGKVQYRKITSVGREASGRPFVSSTDEDGAERVDEADLVIGADGVKSVVRHALFGDDKAYQPSYTGLSGIGGFLTTPLPPQTLKPPSMHFTFGRNGFFGYSPASSPSTQSLMWWSTYETPLSSTASPTAIKAALRARHKHWRDPIIQDIVSKVEVESIYPTWVLDDLPQWGERGIVLIGDAAHALDPTTGQGASQALEDSQTLSLLLLSTLSCTANTPPRNVGVSSTSSGSSENVNDHVDVAIKLFYNIRSPRVREIVERGKKMSSQKADVGVVAEYFMYLFLWAVTRFPSIGKMMLGDVNKKLYTWSAEVEVRKATEKEERLADEADA
ncbi:hypothetical protein N0V90_007605 [Kalmusia sp. IMI 367209]|nr:hypothetical protein N0V90_007605 [Kalmusia sp. IMI 367209]